MRESKYRHYFIVAMLFALLSVAALWSFNTIAEFLGAPAAQYKHAIAAIALLFVVKLSLFSTRRLRHESQ